MFISRMDLRFETISRELIRYRSEARTLWDRSSALRHVTRFFTDRSATPNPSVSINAIRFRAELPSDRPGIREVHEVAFGQLDEADLVDTLRDNIDPFLSYVAVLGDRVVGNVCLSPAQPEQCSTPTLSLVLDPLAVHPAYQHLGIGTRLVTYALKKCREQGVDLVFVQGSPSFYRRCGFKPALKFGLNGPQSILDPVFQVVELTTEPLQRIHGHVYYPPCFTARS